MIIDLRRSIRDATWVGVWGTLLTTPPASVGASLASAMTTVASATFACMPSFRWVSECVCVSVCACVRVCVHIYTYSVSNKSFISLHWKHLGTTRANGSFSLCACACECVSIITIHEDMSTNTADTSLGILQIYLQIWQMHLRIQALYLQIQIRYLQFTLDWRNPGACLALQLWNTC